MPNRLDSLFRSLTGRRAFLFSFAFGFMVRLIPEILSYPWLIGFDTPYYAVRVRNGVLWSDVTSFFSMWLLDGLLMGVQRVSQIDTFLLLKLVGPLLLALNAAGIYYFCRRALGWNSSTSLISVFVFTFQIAALRLSWDLFRNLLGLSILLFSLPLLKSLSNRRSFVLFMVLSILMVAMGLVFPPVGMVAFVVSATANVKLSKVYKGTSILVVALVATTVLLCLFPQLALWLPSRMK